MPCLWPLAKKSLTLRSLKPLLRNIWYMDAIVLSWCERVDHLRNTHTYHMTAIKQTQQQTHVRLTSRPPVPAARDDHRLVAALHVRAGRVYVVGEGGAVLGVGRWRHAVDAWRLLDAAYVWTASEARNVRPDRCKYIYMYARCKNTSSASTCLCHRMKTSDGNLRFVALLKSF